MILSHRECVEATFPVGPPYTDYERIAIAQAKATTEAIKKKLNDYVCPNCSTPGFVYLVIPVECWERIKKGIMDAFGVDTISQVFTEITAPESNQ